MPVQPNNYIFNGFLLSPLSDEALALKLNTVSFTKVAQEYKRNQYFLVITPGLVNTHAHLELTFPEPIVLKPGEDFIDWLLRVISFSATACSSEQKQARCQAGVQELLATGTTTVADISSDGISLDTLEQAGLRGLVALECFAPDAKQKPEKNPRLQSFVQQYQALQTKWQGHERLGLTLSPHSLYNVSVTAWHWLCNTLNPPMVHTHIAESPEEDRWLRNDPDARFHTLHKSILGKQFTPSIVAESVANYLQQSKLIDRPWLMAHGTELSRSDLEALIKRNHQVAVALAHCPRSNEWLHGKTANVHNYQALNIPVGLGTDSRLSCPNLDLRQEALTAQRLHGWSALQTWQHLTIEGARCLGMDSTIGSLEPGKAIDFLVWELPPVSDEESAETLMQRLLSEGQLLKSYVAGQCVYQASNR